MPTCDSMTFLHHGRASIVLLFIALMTSLLLAACHSEAKPGPSSSDRPQPVAPAAPAVPADKRAELNGRWTLIALADVKVNPTPPISMSISPRGEVGGRSAVNGYSAQLTAAGVDNGHFGLSQIAATMMAGPPELMELESRYFKALESARSWRIEGKTLVLSDDHAEVARFTRAAE